MVKLPVPETTALPKSLHSQEKSKTLLITCHMILVMVPVPAIVLVPAKVQVLPLPNVNASAIDVNKSYSPHLDL